MAGRGLFVQVQHPANWMSDADGFVNADSVGTNSITGSAFGDATTIRIFIASRVAAGSRTQINPVRLSRRVWEDAT